ncbi:MAG: GNAT family N-acetyltransferase [Treponema sp.]|nr:GNAT family N-acetyltransferase [Treponema sp.]
MTIKLAEKSDVNRIMDIYAFARDFMAKNGNPNQWGPTKWPPLEVINQDIDKKKLFLCLHEDRIVGVFFYDFGKKIEACYNKIEEGSWSSPETYGVVHRIAGDGSVKGIGSFCINWAFEKAGCLRMDTHPDNLPMQGLLTKLGFKKCGIIHVEEDDYPRFAYEKVE